jgi:hypothetical protein
MYMLCLQYGCTLRGYILRTIAVSATELTQAPALGELVEMTDAVWFDA